MYSQMIIELIEALAAAKSLNLSNSLLCREPTIDASLYGINHLLPAAPRHLLGIPGPPKVAPRALKVTESRAPQDPLIPLPPRIRHGLRREALASARTRLRYSRQPYCWLRGPRRPHD